MINPDRPNLVIDQNNLALMDRKERESKGAGLFSSWTTPVEELDPSLVSADKLKMLQETQQRERERLSASAQCIPPAMNIHLNAPERKDFVTIPLQALKPFKALLANVFEVDVRLTQEQAGMLLEALHAMKTPARMFDAQAVMKCCEQLEALVKKP